MTYYHRAKTAVSLYHLAVRVNNDMRSLFPRAQPTPPPQPPVAPTTTGSAPVEFAAATRSLMDRIFSPWIWFPLLVSSVAAIVATPYVVNNWDYIVSWIIARTRHDPAVKMQDTRSAFHSLPFPKMSYNLSSKPHPNHAVSRSIASAFVDLLANSLGQKAYFHQMSQADQRLGRQGDRTYFWDKDTQVDVRPDESGETIHAFVDVDYYVDMARFLTDHPGPTVLYTLIPEATASVEEGAAFCTTETGEIEMSVSGGASYRHQLWNWGVDSVGVLSIDWGVFGWFNGGVVRSIVPRVVYSAYGVDRRSVPGVKHRSVVLLNPSGRWYGIWALLVNVLSHNTLRRVDMLSRDKSGKPDGYARLRVMTEHGMFVSTSAVNQFNAVTIPVAKDDQVATQATISATTLAVPQVMGIVDTREEAAVLVAYHRLKSADKPDTVHTSEAGVRRYQTLPSFYDETAKPGLQAFMSPIVHGAFSPDDCQANDAAAAKLRITDLACGIEPTPMVLKMIEEFITQVLPDAHSLHPQEYDLVLEKQNRPSQRQLLFAAESTIAFPRKVSSFVKKEAYPDAKPPRMISTINTHDKAEYSTYTYTVAEALHTCPWYAFGLSGAQIAARVGDVCSRADWVINTDFSKFDGRVGPILRLLELHFLLRAFDKQYHPRILDLHRSQYTLPATTRHGVRYDTGYARNSGSPETSAFNSLANAFVNFVALRSYKVGSTYLQSDEAYARLGIYGGDDGLTGNLPADVFDSAAALVGQSAKCETVKRGSFGVKFLARYYSPDVWFGDINSCCDIGRQLSKFHTTVALPRDVTPLEKLVTKLNAFAYTDSNTPLFREWSQALEAYLAENDDIEAATKTKMLTHEELLTQVIPYWAVKEDGGNYPNSDSGWMYQVVDATLPGFDYQRFVRWLSNLTYETLLKPPMCLDPPEANPKEHVFLDGDVHNHPPGWTQRAPPNTRSTTKTTTTYRGRASSSPRGGKTATRPPRTPGSRRGPRDVPAKQ